MGSRGWATASRGSRPPRRGRWAPGDPRRPRGSDAPPRRGPRPRPGNPEPAPRSSQPSVSAPCLRWADRSLRISARPPPPRRPPPPPQAFLDSCPGLSDRHSSLRVEAMTYGSLFGGVDTAVRRDGCPPCPVVVPVFQRTYCWTDAAGGGVVEGRVHGRRRRKATLNPNPRRIGSRTAPADASSGE